MVRFAVFLTATASVFSAILLPLEINSITDQVEDDAFAIARARQVNKDGYAKVLEEKRNQKGK